LAVRYNAALDAMLDEFPTVNIIRFDVFSLLREVVSKPDAFGFTNVTAPCYTGYVLPASPTDTVCPTPDSYIFWDVEHPTAAVHALLAARMLGAMKTDLVADLDQRVIDLALAPAIERALRAKLVPATRALETPAGSSDPAASNALRAFVKSVEAQRGKTIPDAQATSLVERAQQIIELVTIH
jgi:phospholipase/lecithinase/hemolysin